MPETLSRVVAIFSAYLLLVGTLIAFGVLAFYLGHKRTQEICFWIVCTLLLVIPITAIIWYFRQTSWARPRGEAVGDKRRLLARLEESSFARFLSQHFRAITLLSQALYIAQIANAIRLFPKHPRFSLALIVYFVASSFASVLIYLTARMTVRNSELKAFMLETTRDLLNILERQNDVQKHTAHLINLIHQLPSTEVPTEVDPQTADKQNPQKAN